ncbi:MAG: ATP-dependent DNA helicase RecQ [Melioribacteraceae bacterium]|nr:MAG: ATP-dependent DNA helicase RecQ [Melioribacteraceae bacterium]
MVKQIFKVLKDVFGYSEFREHQQEIITAILSGKDTLAVMPTGAGKSICYQIPAILSEGITIVVSPLISLMKDQVEQLKEYGIGALFINSSLTPVEYQNNIDRIISGDVKLVYVAPETLISDRLLPVIKSVKISLFAVDEAHCISQWGHDFRPEYRKLSDLREYFSNTPFAAFTATATERVREDIAENLRFKKHEQFIGSFDRPNLFIQVMQKYQPLNQVLDFLEKYPGQSGIIYCATRKQVESLCEDLQKYGYQAKPYHAGMKDEIRMENQQKFLRDDVKIIVATIAFGMGINKSNVRFVVHYDLPKNIESYYQEIGRAGRDGLRAFCLLLFGYKDIDKIKYFISQSNSEFERKLAYEHLKALVDYAEFYHCRRIPMLEYFGEEYKKKSCGMCDNCNSREKNMFDLTVPAQKYLSCIKRTGESFPDSYVIDILIGKKDPKINEFNHDHISTYGIGKEYTHRQWSAISQQLLKGDYLIKDDNRGPSIVTKKGWNLLQSKELFFGYIPKEETKKISVVSADFGSYDENLFKELKAVRKAAADKISVPPYVIFSDKTLIEMASKKPSSRREMLEISGVGQFKYERYGKMFQNTINAFLGEKRDDAVEDRKKPEVSQTIMKLCSQLNEGKTVMDLMTISKLKKTTIVKYMLKYVQAGYSFPLTNVDELLICSTSVQSSALKKLDSEKGKLVIVYNQMIGKISYDDLSLLLIKYLLEKR